MKKNTPPLRTTKVQAIKDILTQGVTNYRGKVVRAKKAQTQAQALEAIEKKFPNGLPRGPHPQG